MYHTRAEKKKSSHVVVEKGAEAWFGSVAETETETETGQKNSRSEAKEEDLKE